MKKRLDTWGIKSEAWRLRIEMLDRGGAIQRIGPKGEALSFSRSSRMYDNRDSANMQGTSEHSDPDTEPTR